MILTCKHWIITLFLNTLTYILYAKETKEKLHFDATDNNTQ